ncbi:hypothetical protein D3C81_1908300 [compost metagenome]
MHLIDIERFGINGLLLLLPAPASIIPAEALQTFDNGSSPGTELGKKGIRIAFEKTASVRSGDPVLIDSPFLQAGDKKGPHAAGVE